MKLHLIFNGILPAKPTSTYTVFSRDSGHYSKNIQSLYYNSAFQLVLQTQSLTCSPAFPHSENSFSLEGGQLQNCQILAYLCILFLQLLILIMAGRVVLSFNPSDRQQVPIWIKMFDSRSLFMCSDSSFPAGIESSKQSDQLISQPACPLPQHKVASVDITHSCP